MLFDHKIHGLVCVCFHGVRCGQSQAFDVYITPIFISGNPKVKTVLFISFITFLQPTKLFFIQDLEGHRRGHQLKTTVQGTNNIENTLLAFYQAVSEYGQHFAN
jgi:hypothetical protein